MSLPVLVIAANDDWPTDRVVTELTGRGVEVFRMDTADFPQQLSLTGRVDRGHGWAGELATVHRTVTLSRIRAVYYRAPGAFHFPDGMTGPEERFAAAQARAGLGGVVSALDCRWVNHPTFMARAEYKPIQLDAARSCGLRIPPTLVTNRPEAVREFAATVPGPLICKPVASPVLIEDGQLRTVYTRRLAPDDLTDLQGIETTAHLFQATDSTSKEGKPVDDEPLDEWAARREARRPTHGERKAVPLGDDLARGEHVDPDTPRGMLEWDGHQWVPSGVTDNHTTAAKETSSEDAVERVPLPRFDALPSAAEHPFRPTKMFRRP